MWINLLLGGLMNNAFVQTLFDEPLDIVGDIHGEIEALNHLLDVLGYDEQGHHPEQRKLIFVGDLCDRGADSFAVIQRVKALVEQGKAQCVLGNHELNLLIDAKREGNGWFFGSPHEDDHKSFTSRQINHQERLNILNFLATLPIALESEKLRVVHACWDQNSIDILKSMQGLGTRQAYDQFVQMTENHVRETGIAEQAKRESAQYRSQMKNPQADIPFLPYLAQQDLVEQMHNPMKVLTSGAEFLVDQPFYVGGKWRMIDRSAWWEHYQDDIPVIIGHYWRNFKSTDEKTGFFKYIDAVQWFGQKRNVFCVDYSVGKRYVDRQNHCAFTSQLIALRFPENSFLSETGEEWETRV